VQSDISIPSIPHLSIGIGGLEGRVQGDWEELLSVSIGVVVRHSCVTGTHVESNSFKYPLAAFTPRVVVHPRMATFRTLHNWSEMQEPMLWATDVSSLGAVDDGFLICRTLFVSAPQPRKGTFSRALASKSVVQSKLQGVGPVSRTTPFHAFDEFHDRHRCLLGLQFRTQMLPPNRHDF